MPPRDPKPVNRRRTSKLNLDMPETELTGMLHQYCDLRPAWFLPANHPNQVRLDQEITRNCCWKKPKGAEGPGAQKSQEQAVTEWLLEMFDAGAELSVIQRTSALPNLQTKKRLQNALDAASGPAPTGLIIRNPDGTPARVSWLDANGTLMHRPFDGAFPARLPRRTRPAAVHRSRPEAGGTTIDRRPGPRLHHAAHGRRWPALIRLRGRGEDSNPEWK